MDRRTLLLGMFSTAVAASLPNVSTQKIADKLTTATSFHLNGRLPMSATVEDTHDGWLTVSVIAKDGDPFEMGGAVFTMDATMVHPDGIFFVVRDDPNVEEYIKQAFADGHKFVVSNMVWKPMGGDYSALTYDVRFA